MRIGWSTGYREGYWGTWPWTPMMGGSERIVTEMAREMARQGHSVTVRLPYELEPWAGFDCVPQGANLRWVTQSAPSEKYDVLFCADDFARRDSADHTVLVACRSDPPPHTDFDEMVFLSKTHARLMGHPHAPVVGGCVNLADYREPLARWPRRVISTSSPDRCPQASAIGAGFDFVHTYRPVGGVGHEYTRAEVVTIQRSAMAHIYPLDPVRPSDFFSMSVLESLAAGTPVVVSDADAMAELWGDAAWVLPRPVDLGAWTEAVERILRDRALWTSLSRAGKERAKDLTWEKQAARLLAVAVGGYIRAR